MPRQFTVHLGPAGCGRRGEGGGRGSLKRWPADSGLREIAQLGCIPSFAASSAMTGVQVTPLTTMAQARARGMTGSMTAANVTAANAAVGNYFSVGDILMMAPMDPVVAGSGAAADLSAKNCGMTIAAMSQYAHTVGMTVTSSGIFTE